MNSKIYFFALCMICLFMVAACSAKTEKGPQHDQQKEPPEAILDISGKNFKAWKGGYHWEIKRGSTVEAVVADAASPNQAAENIKPITVEPNSEAGITFSGGSTPQLHVYLWEGDNRGSTLPVEQRRITLPGKKGKYVIEIAAKWKNGDSSNTFVVVVK